MKEQSMTEIEKMKIDEMSHSELLSKCRFSPIGDPFWWGDHGDYAMNKIRQFQDQFPAMHTQISKAIGW